LRDDHHRVEFKRTVAGRHGEIVFGTAPDCHPYFAHFLPWSNLSRHPAELADRAVAVIHETCRLVDAYGCTVGRLAIREDCFAIAAQGPA
jgi:hypothetical protein